MFRDYSQFTPSLHIFIFILEKSDSCLIWWWSETHSVCFDEEAFEFLSQSFSV